MKKITAMLIGLALVLGSVGISNSAYAVKLNTFTGNAIADGNA